MSERGGDTSEPAENTTATLVELLLREPEMVAWLEPVRPAEDENDEEPPRAA